MIVSGTVDNTGTLAAAGGMVDVAGVLIGGGTAQISNGGTLILEAGTAQTIEFSGSGTLVLRQPTTFTGALGDLAGGDIIDLVATSAVSATVDGTDLVITEGDGSTLTYQLAAPLNEPALAVKPDGNNGSDLYVGPSVTSVDARALVVGANGTVAITLTFDEAVNVSGGTPSLSLDGGGSADYSSASGSNELTFTYSVGASDQSADLFVSAVALNGASVEDANGVAADLSGALYNPTGLQIDGYTLSLGLGQLDSGVTVSSGGTLIVAPDGLAIDTTIDSGGTQQVYETASSTTVNPGGLQLVYSGGTAVDITVNGGGSEILISGGLDDGAQIFGGTQLVYGYASGATVFAGSQIVENGGIASGTTVSSGGIVEVLANGVLAGAVFAAGGVYAIGSGAALSGYQVGSGGILEVGPSGTVANTGVSAGGTLAVLSGGLAAATTVVSSGSETISAGGSDAGALISGGTQSVYGAASAAVVLAGGSQIIESGGTGNNTIVSSGGTLAVLSGGLADPATIYAGGLEIVSAAVPTSVRRSPAASRTSMASRAASRSSLASR